jgi:O-methyltransferase involved in polyketide biosynthesis
MDPRLEVQLGNIQATLLLPLWARARESRTKDPILEDKLSAEIVDRIDYDFSTIEKRSTQLNHAIFVSRARTFDRVIGDFIREYPGGTIVNIGAGLDTAFSRIDNGEITWYEIDLPDVISLKKKLIPEGKRLKYLAGSFLDPDWFEKIGASGGPVFFLAGGVFIYYDEKTVKGFLVRLAERFPGGEILFDASSKLGNFISNASLRKIKLGGDRLVLTIRKPDDIESWSPCLELKKCFGYFTHLKMRKEWGLATKLQIMLNDRLHVGYFYQVKFKALPGGRAQTGRPAPGPGSKALPKPETHSSPLSGAAYIMELPRGKPRGIKAPPLPPFPPVKITPGAGA